MRKKIIKNTLITALLVGLIAGLITGCKTPDTRTIDGIINIVNGDYVVVTNDGHTWQADTISHINVGTSVTVTFDCGGTDEIEDDAITSVVVL